MIRFSSRSGASVSFFWFSLPSLFTNQSAIYFFFDVCALSSLSLCFKDETRSDPHRKNCLKVTLESLDSLSFFSRLHRSQRAQDTLALFFGGSVFCALIWGLPSPSCSRTRSDPHREWSSSWLSTIAPCQFCYCHSPFLKFNQQVDILLLALTWRLKL